MLYIKKFFLIVLGTALIVVGALGMVLPIVHGTVFLLLGVILLSFESTYIEGKVLYFVQKHELLYRLHTKLEKVLRRWFNK